MRCYNYSENSFTHIGLMRKRVKNLSYGFSLTELMVTILIAGILATIAIPTYRDYVIRAKMAGVLSELSGLLDEVKKEYIADGSIPSSIKGISSGTPTAYTNSDCIAFINYDDGATWTNAGKGALIQAIVNSDCGSGIQGYSEGTSGFYNTVSLAFLDIGESIKNYCGSWYNNGTQVPLKYLPSGCQDSAFADQVTGD